MESSVEPSSTQMTSISSSVWAQIDSRHSLRYLAELYTGTITETEGMAVP